MREEKIYDAIDPQIKKKYNKRFIRSICAIDDLLEKKRYIYDINETGKNGKMEQLIDLLNNLHEENIELKKDIQDKEEIIEYIKDFVEKGDDKSNKIIIQAYSIKPEYGGNFNL